MQLYCIPNFTIFFVDLTLTSCSQNVVAYVLTGLMNHNFFFIFRQKNYLSPGHKCFALYGKAAITSPGWGLFRLFPDEVPERTHGVWTRGFGP